MSNSTDSCGLCCGFPLLLLPTEVISKVLAAAFSDMLLPTDDAIPRSRVAFRTRLRVEGTCRLLREISVGLPWFPDGDISFPQMLRLLHQRRQKRTTQAMEVLFIGEPRRFRGVQGFDFGIRCRKDVAARLIEAARDIKTPAGATLPIIRSLTITSCEEALYEPLIRGWSVEYVYLDFERRNEEMSHQQLADVVAACAKDMVSFKLAIGGNGSGDDGRFVEQAIGAALGGLRGSEALRELKINHIMAPCTNKATIPFADLAAVGRHLWNLETDNIRVTAPRKPIAPFPEIRKIGLRYPPCFCPDQHGGVAFASPSSFDLVDPTHGPLFPSLDILTVHGPGLPRFGQLRAHCPKLRHLMSNGFTNVLEAGLLVHGDRELEALVRGGLETLSIACTPTVELLNAGRGVDPANLVLYERFERAIAVVSRGDCAVVWKLGSNRMSSFLAAEFLEQLRRDGANVDTSLPEQLAAQLALEEGVSAVDSEDEWEDVDENEADEDGSVEDATVN